VFVIFGIWTPIAARQAYPYTDRFGEEEAAVTLHAFIRYCGAPLLCEGVGVCDIGVGFSDALDGVGTWVTGCVVVPECETGVCETG